MPKHALIRIGEDLSIRKYDSFHDAKWNFDERLHRASVRRNSRNETSRKTAKADLINERAAALLLD